MQDQFSIQSENSQALKPLQEIGGLIRNAREAKNMSIEDLAGSLRIGQEQLIALENGEEDLLPEKVYIKAMIRRVSERLHLDVGVLLNQFQSNQNALTLLDEPKTVQERFLLRKHLPKVPAWILITGLACIATSGFAVTYLSSRSLKSPNTKEIIIKELAPKTKAIDSSYHIVAPGQTLSMISKFHEIPLKRLIKINDLNNPDKLKIGAKISLKDVARRNIVGN